MTYLDYNATAPLRPEARAALIAALDETGNPSSVHGPGRRARRLVEDGREAVARLVAAPAAAVTFTGSATEANNWALAAAGGRRVLIAADAHDSLAQAAPEAARVPLRPDGRLDLEALDGLLADGPALLAVMLANNETGVVQPAAEIAALARRHGALLHVDAVQAAGRLPLDFAALDADSLALSAHKLGGPQGVGALVLRPGLEPAPLLRGGGQERRRRAGTEAVAAIAGFGAAAAAAARDIADMPRLAALRDGIEARLRALCPGLPVFGAEAPRLANTSCLAMPGVAATVQLMHFDLAGIAVSAGAACSSGKVAASRVLTAMGVDPARAGEAVRVSLGWATQAADLDRFAESWAALWGRLGRRDAA
ncbi:MAG TPA: cysteine desulfurase family protein [Alphaproteobacteria bacterium]|nr:cysteine desulfurase family protein [Alphaproteobacteria bacterium]